MSWVNVLNQGLTTGVMCTPRGTLKGPSGYAQVGRGGVLPPCTAASQEQGEGGVGAAAPFHRPNRHHPAGWRWGRSSHMASTTQCCHSMWGHCHSPPPPATYLLVLSLPPRPLFSIGHQGYIAQKRLKAPVINTMQLGLCNSSYGENSYTREKLNDSVYSSSSLGNLEEGWIFVTLEYAE